MAFCARSAFLRLRGFSHDVLSPIRMAIFITGGSGKSVINTSQAYYSDADSHRCPRPQEQDHGSRVPCGTDDALVSSPIIVAGGWRLVGATSALELGDLEYFHFPSLLPFRLVDYCLYRIVYLAQSSHCALAMFYVICCQITLLGSFHFLALDYGFSGAQVVDSP